MVEAPELLSGAAERAVQTARRDRGSRDAPDPPAALRPFLGFTKRLPQRALRAVLDVLDEDEGFRSRVADGADEAQLGRASLLFLTRPASWQQDLDRLFRADAEERHDIDVARTEMSSQRRVEQLLENVERLRADLEVATAARADAERTVAGLRADVLSLNAERNELAESVARLDSERARAVRELKAAESISTDRLERQRSDRAALDAALARIAELEASAASESVTVAVGGTVDHPERSSDTAETASSTWADDRRRTAAEAVGNAAVAARELGAALAAAAEALADDTEEGHTGNGEVVGNDSCERDGTAGTTPPRPPRRVPLRLRGGVLEGTAEGMRQLLASKELVAIVDGYNVTMEGWPLLDPSAQRDTLIRALGALQATVVARIHVVFDGDSDGARPHVAAPLPIRVHFSAAGTEADDVILSTVKGLPTDTPVLVISSDRRVSDGARRLGANVARSSELLDLLRT